MMLWLDGLHVARTDARQSSVTSGWLTRDPFFIVTERATACCCLLLRGTSLLASLLEGKEIGSIAEGSQISTNACYERNIFFFWVAYILDCHHLIRDSSSKDGSRGRLASSIDDSDDIATLQGSQAVNS